MAKLTAMELRRLAKPETPDGLHGDGGGLYFQVRGPVARSWVFRFTMGGKAKAMGLGSYPGLSLALARESAAAARQLTREGVDPIKRRKQEREALAAASTATVITFRQAAEALIAAREADWRNAKHRAQWRATLGTYAYPFFGDVAVDAVDTEAVLAALTPIWQAKRETASRVRGRIEAVLGYAAVRRWRVGDNPARWKDHMAVLLGAGGHAARVKHHPALPWQEIAPFLARVAGKPASSALALRFAILTAARTGEALGATWREIDLEAATWTVPAERMKGGREHRVPLSGAALTVLRNASALQGSSDPSAYVFPGAHAGRPLSNMALLMLIRGMDARRLTTHGFRSTFRDWVAEASDHPGEVAEMALAHTVGDKVEAAYRRGSLFEKRRRLMEDWASWCAGEPAASDSDGKTLAA